jgi:exosortase
MLNETTKLRNFWLVGFLLLSILLFWKPLKTLAWFSWQHEYCTHIALIPFVTAYLLYLKRRAIFERTATSMAGICLLPVGLLFYGVALTRRPAVNLNDYLSGAVFSIVLVWMAIFAICYGRQAFRSAIFPLCFLFLMVPIPTVLLEKAIYELQMGSTSVTQWLLKAADIPVFREGFILVLPGLSIEVAKECSGIRTTMALFITGLLASYLLLKSTWRRTAFVLLTIPMALIKNGIRIATLSVLSIFVDSRFMTSSLHQDGGILFFLLALLLLAPILKLLQKSESGTGKQSEPSSGWVAGATTR